MDPVTALGLAGAVVTFIDFGTKIVMRLAELSEAGDIPEVFRDISTRLPLLISIIRRTRDGADNLPPKAEEAFKEVVKHCFEQVNQLDEVLRRVRISKGDSRLRKIIKASTSLIEERRVQRIAIALKDNVQLLTFLNVTPADKARPTTERMFSEPLPSYTSVTRVFLVPFSRDEQFVGRESHLRSIASTFETRNRAAICGIGGVG